MLSLPYNKNHFLLVACATNNTQGVSAELAYRVGHVNPIKAVDPKLMYDNTQKD